jgi:chromosome transmission fidelity protein 4
METVLLYLIMPNGVQSRTTKPPRCRYQSQVRTFASISLCYRLTSLTGANPFAKKPGDAADSRNPFARNNPNNKSLHKSESFFEKAEAAETGKWKGMLCLEIYFRSMVNVGCVATASAANGRGPKKDNTKQSTLFGLPAVPPPEKTAKRARNKGGAIPSKEICATEPDASESQDVEMAESHNTEDLASQAVAVDSQQESQATEVVTEVEVRFFPVLHLKVIQSNAQEGGSPEPIDWPATPPSMGQNLPDEISAS